MGGHCYHYKSTIWVQPLGFTHSMPLLHPLHVLTKTLLLHPLTLNSKLGPFIFDLHYPLIFLPSTPLNLQLLPLCV